MLWNHQRFRDDLADGHARIETRVGILEDDLDVATIRLQIASLE